MTEQIINFCKSSTKPNWEKLDNDSKELFRILGLFCIKNDKGKIDIAKQILKLGKLAPEQFYLTPQQRIWAAQNIEVVFKNVKKVNGKQCINGTNKVLLDFIQLGKMLGSGSFGNVYEACAPKPCTLADSYKFAVKLARVTKDEMDNPFNPNVPGWAEYLILHDILNPLVENGICINLPYLIETFTCDQCNFKDLLISTGGGNNNFPCLIFLTELAQGGTLKDWFKRKDLKEDDWYNALFQMMAGIHAIQMYGQVWNYDVKSVNTLVYNVTPGGYWKYTILGQDFYIPNRGYIIILNDFGVSSVFSPDYCFKYQDIYIGKSLGLRSAMIIDGKYSPFSATRTYSDLTIQEKPTTDKIVWGDKSFDKVDTYCSQVQSVQYKTDTGFSILVCDEPTNKKPKVLDAGYTFTPEQMEFLKSKGIPTDSSEIDFYKHPDIIPPLELRGDTQDSIRTFIGGPRYSQGGRHPTPEAVPHPFRTLLEPYLFNNGTDGRLNIRNCISKIFTLDPAMDLAGYFIKDFYTKFYTKFNQQPSGSPIATFTI